MNDPDSASTAPQPCPDSCLSRRGFLLSGAAGVATVLLADLFPGRVLGESGEREVRLGVYPAKLVGRLSTLVPDQPVEFFYPADAPHCVCFLVQLGRRAGGGIGPGQDVVAFSALCTHMGGGLLGYYDRRHKVAGPCPLHLTSFDLTRHGIVVAGHATQNLPQVVLEARGDEIYAVGIAGLIYGTHDNLVVVRGKRRAT